MQVINKLNKEKKYLSENAAKSAEDLSCAEDKVGHLNQVKFFLHLNKTKLKLSWPYKRLTLVVKDQK